MSALDEGPSHGQRQAAFRRNPRLEALLAEVNDLLEPAEAAVQARFQRPRYPVVLVMGLPRSGTTLLMQWLAHSGRFAYPSNLLSRFYAAPFMGAKIQQLLTDPAYGFGDELVDLGIQSGFQSHLGKTRGALAPNEFWYFWRRFIPQVEPRTLDDDELAQVKIAELLAALAAIEAVFDKPLAMKGLIMALNMPFLDQMLPRALFLYVDRHPFYNIQSLLEAREAYYGDRRSWYSVKPAEYSWLRELNPIEQVVGQVIFTSRAMKRGLDAIAPPRQLSISYEAFCSQPAVVFRQVTNRLIQQGFPADWTYQGPPSFEPTNQVRLPDSDCHQIISAYRRLAGAELSP